MASYFKLLFKTSYVQKTCSAWFYKEDTISLCDFYKTELDKNSCDIIYFMYKFGCRTDNRVENQMKLGKLDDSCSKESVVKVLQEKTAK